MDCLNCGEDTSRDDGRSPGDIGTGVSDDFDQSRFCSFECEEEYTA